MTLATGVPLQDMTGASTIFGTASDDNQSVLTSFGSGFTFMFRGKPYTNFSVNVNGFIRLGGTNISGSSWVNENFTASNVGPLIAARWDDLHTGTTGNVRWKLNGTAPNRIAVIQWFVEIPYSGGANPANTTFQCLLYENGGKIEFVYDNAIANSIDGGYTIGIKDTVAGTPTFSTLTVASPWTSSTASYSTVNTTNSLAITAGSSVSWTPAVISLDLGLTTPVLPGATMCNGNNTVSVTLKNYSTLTHDFSVNPVTLTVNVTGPSPTSFNTTINSGTLAANATQNVVFTTTYNVTQVGTYNFASSLSLTGDQDPSNNNLNYSSSTEFSVVASSNLYTVCDGISVQASAVTQGLPYNLASVPFAPTTPTGTVTTLASGLAAVTPMTINSLDDGTWENISLPFTFTYYGTPQTKFNVSTNGFITFGASLGSAYCCSGQIIPSAAAPNSYIALSHEDFNFTLGGSVDYYTNGVAPNRRFVVRFTGMVHHGSTGAPTTGQIILHETTNIVEFQVTSVVNGAGDFTTMGIENNTGTSAVIVNGRNSTAGWSATNEGWQFQPPSSFVTTVWSPSTGVSNTTIANPTITPPIGTTTYTATITNPNTGCVFSDTLVLTNLGAGNAAPTTVNDSICEGETAHLEAIGDPTLNWYATAVGGAIVHTGPTWDSAWTSTTSYWVESFNGVCPSFRTEVKVVVTPKPVTNPTADPEEICLGETTQLNAGTVLNGTLTAPNQGGNGASGVAFNVTATNTITLNYISAVMTPSTGTVAIYYLPGGFAGPTLNTTAGWTLITNSAPFTSTAPATFTCAPNCPPTLINYDINLTIPAGQTYGIAMAYQTGGATWVYTTSPTAFNTNLASDANLTIKVGAGGALNAWGNSPRAFNGSISYSAGNPNLGFAWSPAGELNSSTIMDPVATPTAPGTSTYSVLVTDQSGCTATASVDVTVNPIPDPPVFVSSTTFCGCGTSTIEVTGTGGVIQWYDAAVGGNLVGTGSTFVTPVFCGPTTFYAAELDASGECESERLAVLITPNVADPVSAGSDVNICDGAAGVTLTATSPNDPDYNYTWAPAAGLSSTTGASVTANPSTTTSYIVTGTDAVTGCSAKDTVTVFVGTTPSIASVTANPTEICEGDSVQLTAIAVSGGSVAGFTGAYNVPSWTVSHTAGDLGVVNSHTTTSLSMSSSNGATGQTSIDLTHTILTTGTVSFNWNYSTVDGANWDFPQVYLNGVRTTVNGYSTAGAATQSGTAVVSVNAGDVFGFTMTSVDNTGGAATTTFTNVVFAGATSPLSYSWSPATGLSNTSISNPKASPPAGTTTYTVTVSSEGCSTSANVDVIVNQVPDAPVCSNDTVCGQGIANLSATGSGGTFIWTDSTGGNILSTSSSYSPNVTSTNSYYVREVPSLVLDSIGHDPVTTPTAGAGFFPTTAQGMWFKVTDPGGVIIHSVDIYTNTPVGTPFQFAIQDSLGTTYGTVSGVTTATNPYFFPGPFGPPFTKQTVVFDIYLPPSAVAYRMRPLVNPNLLVHQDGTVAAGAPYQIPGKIQILAYGDMSPATFFGTNTFGFFYNWKVQTGCFGPACVATAVVEPAPPLTITPSGSIAFCGSGSVDLTAGGDPSWTNFTWSPATGLSSTTGATVTATPTVTTTYTVTATDGISGGCTDTTSITITVNGAPFVTVDPAPFDTLCLGTSFTLNSSAGSSSFKQIGTTVDPSQVTGLIFNGANASQRAQILYRASELNAAGLVGPTAINSIAFNVAFKLSSQPYAGFTVRMGNAATPGCLVSTTYQGTGMNTVFSGNYSTVGGWNTINFNTPFNWDGSSDIIVETCFLNASNTFFDQVYTSNVPGCNVMRSDNADPCGDASGALLTARPNTRFTGGQVLYSWSPVDDLDNASIADPVYTSTSTGNKSYTLTVTDPATGCVETATVDFVVSNTPQIPVASIIGDTAFCFTGTPAMTVGGTTGNFQWQMSSNGINFIDISGATNDTLIDAAITSDTYYRVYAYCGGDSVYSNVLTFTVFAPAVISSEGDSICGQGNVNLSAQPNTGYFIQWYGDAGLTNYISNGNDLTTFVTQTDTFYAVAVSDTNAAGVSEFFGGTITIPSSGNGSPYPSTINAAGLAGGASVANVKINGFSHTFTNDVDIVLVSPTGQISTIMSDQGDFTGVTNIDLVFEDGAPVVPAPVTAGTWSPSDDGISDNYPAPGPGSVLNAGSLAGFTGDLNGTWSLYVVDDVGGDAGTITSWSIEFNNPSCKSAPVEVIAYVSPAAAFSIVADDESLCEGQSTDITVTDGIGSYQSFTWSPAAGLSSTSGSSVTATPLTTTTYTVVAIDNINNCQASDSVTITVSPAPVFTITTDAVLICNGDSVQLNVNVDATASSGSGGPAPTGYCLPTYSSGTGFGDWISLVEIEGTTLNNASGAAASPYFTLYPQAGSTTASLAAGQTYTLNVAGGTFGTAHMGVWIDADRNGVFDASEFLGNSPNAGGESTVSMSITIPASAAGGDTRLRIRSSDTAPGPASGEACDATNSSFGEGEDYIVSVIPEFDGSYSWTPTTDLINPTSANPIAIVNNPITYTVTVTNNATGCSAQDSIFLNTAALPSPVITPGDTLLCAPDVIYMHVVDVGDYPGGYPVGTTIDWVNIVNGLTQDDSVASSNGSVYIVKVTLPNGCFAYSDTVTVITRSVSIVDNITPEACGNGNGSIVATVSSSPMVPPYRFIWMDNLNNIIRDTVTSNVSDSIVNLTGGTYKLEVLDNQNGSLSCTSGPLTFVVPGSVGVTASIPTWVNSGPCPGLNNGSASVVTSGGTMPLTYLWSTGSTASSISGVGGGTYTITVTDALGCSDTAVVVIDEPAPIVLNLVTTDPLCSGDMNGSASVSPTGGTLPYDITWYNDQFDLIGSGNSVSGLAAGEYTVLLLDGNGCDASIVFQLNNPAPVSITSFTPANGPVGTSVTITGVSFTGATSVSFNGTAASYTVNSSTSITAVVPVGATTGQITVVTPCGTAVSTGVFTVTVNGTLNLHVLIQGYYVGGGQMISALTMSGVGVDPNESDTIYVELRDQFSPSTVVATSSAILDINGNALFTIPGSAVGGSYYIVVLHRNAVQTWSALPVTFSGATTYDFATSSSQAYNGNMIEVEPGIWAVYSGDIAPQDEFIDLFDQIALDNDLSNGVSGYLATDLNGDGFIDLFDQIILDNNTFNGIFSDHP